MIEEEAEKVEEPKIETEAEKTEKNWPEDTHTPEHQAPSEPTVYGSALDLKIFHVSNRLRTDPRSFLPWLRNRAHNATNPRVKAKLENAIKSIDRMRGALNPLVWSDGLSLAARDRCYDTGPLEELDGLGSDGSTLFDRINRYGDSGWFRGENLSFSENKPDIVNDIVMGLFIDDSTPGHQHRARMWSPNFKVTGIFSCL